jgi:PAS domain S-box-containing protein
MGSRLNDAARDRGLYRQLFENAPIGIINVALDTTPLMVNERAAAAFGYDSPAQFLAEVRSMLDLWVDPKERDRAAEIMLTTGVLRDFEVEMKRRDGTRMTLLVSANPTRDESGEVVGIQVSGIDITDRIRNEERLEEAQAQASIGFWAWRLDTNEYSATEQIATIFGVRVDPREVDMATLLALVHPDDRKMLGKAMSAVLLRAGATFEHEFRIVTPAGQVKWAVLRGRVHDDAIQVFGSVQDITDQKRITEQLTELNRMKSDFVSIVAHDLQTPMTVAGGYVAYLKQAWAQIAEDERRQVVDRIEGSLGRLQGLVSSILEVARLDSGTATFDVEPFDLGETVRSAADEVCAAAAHSPCSVAVEGDLPPALADGEGIWRVTANLVSNALKYSPPDAPVDVSVGRRDDRLIVSVRDAGPGISPSDQRKLFQRFSRLESANGSRGSGLGLFICKSIVESLGGSIWVDSSVGEGSTFTFTVPAA